MISFPTFWLALGLLISAIYVIHCDFKKRKIGDEAWIPAIIGVIVFYGYSTLGPNGTFWNLSPLLIPVFVAIIYVLIFGLIFRYQLRGMGGADFIALVVFSFWPNAFFISVLLSFVFIFVYLYKTHRLNTSIMRGGLNVPYAGFLAASFIVWFIYWIV